MKFVCRVMLPDVTSFLELLRMFILRLQNSETPGWVQLYCFQGIPKRSEEFVISCLCNLVASHLKSRHVTPFPAKKKKDSAKYYEDDIQFFFSSDSSRSERYN